MASRKALTEEQRLRKSERSKALREQRRAEHRCACCGEQDERTLAGLYLCAECREKRLEANRRGGGSKAYSMYEPSKKAHICVSCKKQDAYTLAGRAYCFECNEEKNAKARKRRAENREKYIQKDRERYRSLKEQGVCMQCGKPLDRDGVFCKRCNMRRNRRYAKASREEKKINWPRGSNGICWQCNKEPVLNGKRLCKACYDKAYAILCEKATPRLIEHNALSSRPKTILPRDF